jgi:hypothetical protein
MIIGCAISLGQAKRFLQAVHTLFPSVNWQISIPPELSKETLAKELNLNNIGCRLDKNLKASIKLELISQKHFKSLSVFRYCMLILAVFQHTPCN